MTSAVGGGRGSPKSRQKEQNQLICDSNKGEVKKSENFADIIYGSPLSSFASSIASLLSSCRVMCQAFLGQGRRRAGREAPT